MTIYGKQMQELRSVTDEQIAAAIAKAEGKEPKVMATVYPTEIEISCRTCGYSEWFPDRQTKQAREAEEGHRCS